MLYAATWMSLEEIILSEISQSQKDNDWLNGYKNKAPIYVVYKRPTSKQGTHKD